MQGTIRRTAQPHTVKFANELPEGQVLAWLSSGEVDRMGDVIEQGGIGYSAFMRGGGPVLWQHDSKYPVARTVRIGLVNGRLQAVAQFPPAGTSSQSDECYRLMKADVVTGSSIGFLPRRWELIDPRKPGIRFTQVELVEFSFVSVPANCDALIIGKSFPALSAPLSYRTPPPSALQYSGTLAQRRAQLHRDYPELEEAAAERDAAILQANTKMTGRERRRAVAAAWAPLRQSPQSSGRALMPLPAADVPTIRAKRSGPAENLAKPDIFIPPMRSWRSVLTTKDPARAGAGPKIPPGAARGLNSPRVTRWERARACVSPSISRIAA